MVRLEPLACVDDIGIDALLDAAFEPGRRARTAYAIRTGMAWLTGLSFAALGDDGAPQGLLQSWPVSLAGDDGAMTPLVMVGPVAVHPDAQGRGIGRALMDRLIDAVDAAPAGPLVMIGDPDYYGRFWRFSAGATAGWRVPGPVEQHRLLARHAGPLPTAGILGPRRP